jgi:hypothetical protein
LSSPTTLTRNPVTVRREACEESAAPVTAVKEAPTTPGPERPFSARAGESREEGGAIHRLLHYVDAMGSKTGGVTEARELRAAQDWRPGWRSVDFLSERTDG